MGFDVDAHNDLMKAVTDGLEEIYWADLTNEEKLKRCRVFHKSLEAHSKNIRSQLGEIEVLRKALNLVFTKLSQGGRLSPKDQKTLVKGEEVTHYHDKAVSYLRATSAKIDAVDNIINEITNIRRAKYASSNEEK